MSTPFPLTSNSIQMVFSEPGSSSVWTRFTCDSMVPLNQGHLWFHGCPEPGSSVVPWLPWTRVICVLAIFVSNSDIYTKKDIRQTNPFLIVSKKIQYPGKKLTKYLKDLYNKSWRILWRKNAEYIGEWKDLLCSYLGTILKFIIQPKAIFRFNSIPIKTLMTLFTATQFKYLYKNIKDPPDSQCNFKQKIIMLDSTNSQITFPES